MFDKLKNILGLEVKKEELRLNPLSEDSPKPEIKKEEPETNSTSENAPKPKPKPKPKAKSKAKAKPKTKKKKEEPTLSAKDLATKEGEPYIAINKVIIDPNDLNNGAFELDWNDKFLVNLVKQGYKIKKEDTDQEIVDRWFQTVCRNIALELYEQEVADPDKRSSGEMRVIRQRDLGNGRTEVS